MPATNAGRQNHPGIGTVHIRLGYRGTRAIDGYCRIVTFPGNACGTDPRNRQLDLRCHDLPAEASMQAGSNNLAVKKGSSTAFLD